MDEMFTINAKLCVDVYSADILNYLLSAVMAFATYVLNATMVMPAHSLVRINALPSQKKRGQP